MTNEQQQRLARIRELRVSYMQWHHAGMAALERRDFDALGDAIRAEAAILDEQKRLLAMLEDASIRE